MTAAILTAVPPSPAGQAPATHDLSTRYATLRSRTEALAAPLSAEDCCVQSMPDASPAKWHLAHTTWFFETFILERWEPDFRPHDAAYRVLFNSYYNTVGDKHPRPRRGLLTRPSLAEVLAYRAAVDRRLQALLTQAGDDRECAALVELGLNHEEQHQELLLTDVKHLLSCNPLLPAYSSTKSAPAGSNAPAAGPLHWRAFDGGIAEIGAGEKAVGTAGFCFDNETPRHHVYLQPYRLASRLATNAEYAAFIEAGGYRDPALWLSDGWDWRSAENREHPLYWRRVDEKNSSAWMEFTLQGLQPLAAERPAVHLSYYEADAFARWSGARLPSEAEWEHAVAQRPREFAQLFGEAWQWTSSSYSPYPGFQPAAGAVGEYNGKFMVNQYVLRGSSRATPDGHSRASYRNFFPAPACWQFSGIRLAKD